MTQPPPLSPDEPSRLNALRQCNVVNSPLEERFERITRMAKRLLGVDIVAISLVEADRQWFKSVQGLNAEGTSRDVSFCGHAILNAGAMVIPDATKDERFVRNPLVVGPPNIRGYAGHPVRAIDGSKIGTLCAITTQPRHFSEDDLETLGDLAVMVEAELRTSASNAVQAELLEEVSQEKRKALVDPLTRVWSREGVLSVAAETIHRTTGNNEGAALVMVDLDRFKEVNDTHGHAAGDEVLRIAARRMLGSVREGDVVGRLSGDEFLLVLSPCDSNETAVSVSERVLERLTERPAKWNDEKIEVSASFGVRFIYPGDASGIDEVLELADRALYEAKHAGRNRVGSISAAA